MNRDDPLSTLKNQVKRAHRQLLLQRFVAGLGWSLFASLLLGVLAVAIPKFWAVSVDARFWYWGWLLGTALVGTLIAAAWAYRTRLSPVQAAIEVDQRFQLKERVSSSLAMDNQDLEGEAGRALLSDAARRLDRVDVSTAFPVKLDWRSALPLVPAIIALLLVFLPDAQQTKEVQAKMNNIAVKKQIRRTTEDLKKKIIERKKKGGETGNEGSPTRLQQAGARPGRPSSTRRHQPPQRVTKNE